MATYALGQTLDPSYGFAQHETPLIGSASGKTHWVRLF
jgi:hypothetical protein